MLQVSIFQTLQNNLYRVNFSLLLLGVMAIADEVDSQLAQAMTGYISESKVDGLPVTASAASQQLTSAIFDVRYERS